MLFSSNVFLYLFFPGVLIGYGVLCGLEKLFSVKLLVPKNLWLTAASLGFYLFGSGRLIFLLLAVVAADYFAARRMERGNRKRWMILAVAVNLGLLAWFKYLNFLLDNLSALYVLVTRREGFAEMFRVILPIGISFYIFQALSYVIDVYREKVPPQKNFLNLLLYISFFPQLIAGPIVRYDHVMNELSARKETLDDVYFGFCRFCIGLGKKVLIADLTGEAVDAIFAAGELQTPVAWIGIGLYTLQIYYDFSGYSDMAIGMARIFGFRFRENFRMPYLAQNITEFWGRWHISLSSFLKEYLYIPLGGNRRGEKRTYLNLMIVFALCGLWHGAAWTFVVWGIYHGALRSAERLLREKYHFVPHGPAGQAVTLLLVMAGWVIFRSGTVGGALNYLGTMFGITGYGGFPYYRLSYYVNWQVALAGAAGTVGALIPFTRAREKLRGTALHGLFALACLIVSMIYLSDASFNAFIYFQF